jgi:hypothetical protein
MNQKHYSYYFIEKNVNAHKIDFLNYGKATSLNIKHYSCYSRLVTSFS